MIHKFIVHSVSFWQLIIPVSDFMLTISGVSVDDKYLEASQSPEITAQRPDVLRYQINNCH